MVQAELKARIRAVLFADTYGCQHMNELSDERKRFAACHRSGSDSFRHLQTYFGLYTNHYLVPGLPADTNVVENVIKQLGKKLRLMEGFATLESADRFCRLLAPATGSKRFTGSRNGNNGRAPLEAAGVDLQGRDRLGSLHAR